MLGYLYVLNSGWHVNSVKDLYILPIGNLSSFINPECFLVPLNLNVSQLGLTLNLLIGCV